MTKAPLSLILTKDQETILHGFINEGYPHETCGLFIGQKTEAGWTVSEVTQAGNLNTERAEDRFQLDPKDFMATDNRAREMKQEIIGIWHSHPDHPAAPSPTDLEAAWEGYSYLIAKVTKEGVEVMTSWRLVSGAFEEEVVLVD
jgi:proteasome lid subunit RPN8/RPN11